MAPDDGGVTRQRRLLWLLPAPNALAVAALQRLRRGPSCHSVTPLATSAKLGLGLGCIAPQHGQSGAHLGSAVRTLAPVPPALWQCRPTLAQLSHLGSRASSVGSRASSRRASQLTSGWCGAPREETGPLGVQPLPLVLERAASQAAHFPAFDPKAGDHAGPRDHLRRDVLEVHTLLDRTGG